MNDKQKFEEYQPFLSMFIIYFCHLFSKKFNHNSLNKKKIMWNLTYSVRILHILICSAFISMISRGKLSIAKYANFAGTSFVNQNIGLEI